MFPVLAGSNPSGYNLTRSVRLRSSASASLSRTFGSPTNNKIWTISVWAKRGNIGSRNFIAGTNTTGGSNAFYFDWDSDALEFGEYTSSWQWRLVTTQVFRDPSAWYHIVVAVDTTQATSSNRVKMYVNGSQVTAFSTASYPTQNLNTYWNQSGQAARFGEMNGASLYYDGYLAEINFIDGQALTPSSFGSTNTLTGVWQPAPYSGGSYGTNGFELQFTDNSALTTSSNVGLGKDFSGNGNYWTTNNISITTGVTYDSMTDVPTLTSATAANFAVLNPLDKSSSITTSNGNLAASTSSSASHNLIRSTIAIPSSGKWYAEMSFDQTMNGAPAAAFALIAASASTTSHPVSAGNFCVYGSVSTTLNSGSTGGASVTGMTSGQIWQFAVDADNNQAWIGLNNAWFNVYTSGATTGNPSTLTNPTFTGTMAGLFLGADFVNASGSINFGQRPFSYTPPTGFVSLNTYNLPTSTIVKGNTVFDAALWTGNGAAFQDITGIAFKSDFAWLKCRSTTDSNNLVNSVIGGNKVLQSNNTNAEVTADMVDAWLSNGITVDLNENVSGRTYVGWLWQAGQGTTSTNTSGSITSTVSVNASAGFSIVSYTGTGANATVGHGLGVAPQLIIVKVRDSAGWLWGVYHVSVGNTGYMRLNATDAITTAGNAWNNTSPTSTVFSLGSGGQGNNSGGAIIAYCWTPIAGYSAFGSYTGNGSTDGPFVYTGFRPRWVMMKCTNAASDWYLFDTARDPYNVSQAVLYPNLSDAESTFSTRYFDILSNGFKLRTTANPNTSNTFIYMAFAENPFKNALAR